MRRWTRASETLGGSVGASPGVSTNWENTNVKSTDEGRIWTLLAYVVGPEAPPVPSLSATLPQPLSAIVRPFLSPTPLPTILAVLYTSNANP